MTQPGMGTNSYLLVSIVELNDMTDQTVKQTSSPAKLLLGAHVSIAGGVHNAIPRGEALGCTAIQIFTKNASQWKSKPLTEQEVRDFKLEQSRTGIMVVAHDGYLINLGSPKTDLLLQSKAAFMEEIDRAEQLEIPYLVMHPGAHVGSGEDAGLNSIIQSLNAALTDTTGYRVRILLENTAGQGTALGYSFEHLSRIINDSAYPERMGMCLDTCHAFAAGYDLSGNPHYEHVMEELDVTVGLDRLKALHLNDCIKGLGCRVDRHEHIGRGMLGLECFRLIMNDARLRNVPKFIETPKTLGGHDMDPVNLSLLKSLISD
ncbi:MAG TPA: deoxyribonuclease IV [Desulfomonilaceae bacterium]|nr:deoxyribonuclease IV [Desulfomonilaceae bacterium]